MKKLFISVIAALSFIGSYDTIAQSTSFYKTSYKSRNSGSFHKGDNVISLGHGVGNTAFSNINSFGTRGFGLGPIYGKYEYGIMDEVSVGARLGIGSGHYKWNGVKANNFVLAAHAMGYYHFNKLIPVKQLDVYAGLGLGFRQRSYERILGNGTVVDDSDFNPSVIGVVGAKWYFTQGFGVYAETGYDGLSSLNLGVSFRF